MPAVIRVFDPAMCCSTGVCGPSVDPELVRFSADVDWLRQQGVEVQRFNLSQEPGAFASEAVVKEALQRGPEVLPLVLVDGCLAVEGTYPSRETLAALAGVVVKAPGGCCGGKTGGSQKEGGCCGDKSEGEKAKGGCCGDKSEGEKAKGGCCGDKSSQKGFEKGCC